MITENEETLNRLLPKSQLQKQLQAFKHHIASVEDKFSLQSLQKALEHLTGLLLFVNTTTRRSQHFSSPQHHNNNNSIQSTGGGGGESNISPSSSSSTSSSTTSIQFSIQSLRNSIQRVKRKAGKGARDHEMLTIIDSFLYDCQFMRNIQRYFVENIYFELYQQCYHPNLVLCDLALKAGGDLLFQENPNDNNNSDDDDDDDDEDEENENKFSSSSTKAAGGFFLTETNFTKDDNVFQRHLLHQFQSTTKQLYNLFSRWENLSIIETIVPNLNLYENQSEEILKENNCKIAINDEIYPLLRLLPDLLYKAKMCVQLAEEWIWQYDACHSHTPDENRSHIETFTDRIQLLELKQQDLEQEINRLEHLITIQRDEVKFLQTKEKHIENLLNDVQQMENYRDEKSLEYSQIIHHRQETMRKLENTIQGTQRFGELSLQIQTMEREMIESYKNLQLAEYRLNLTQSNCHLEVSTLADIVQFANAEEEKLQKNQRQMAMLKRIAEKNLQKLTFCQEINEQRNKVMNMLKKQFTTADDDASSTSTTITSNTNERQNNNNNNNKPSAAGEIYVIQLSPQADRKIKTIKNSTTFSSSSSVAIPESRIIPTIDPPPTTTTTTTTTQWKPQGKLINHTRKL